MPTEKELLKECLDLCREAVEILVGERLEIAKRFAFLEDRIKSLDKLPSDKPSLFNKDGTPAVEPVKPVVGQSADTGKEIAEKYPHAAQEMAEGLGDPLKKRSKAFDTPAPDKPVLKGEGAGQIYPWDKPGKQEIAKPPSKPIPPPLESMPDDDLPF